MRIFCPATLVLSSVGAPSRGVDPVIVFCAPVCLAGHGQRQIFDAGLSLSSCDHRRRAWRSTAPMQSERTVIPVHMHGSRPDIPVQERLPRVEAWVPCLLPLCICHANPGPRGRACRPHFDRRARRRSRFSGSGSRGHAHFTSGVSRGCAGSLGPGGARVDDAVLKQPVYLSTARACPPNLFPGCDEHRSAAAIGHSGAQWTADEGGPGRPGRETACPAH